MILNSWNFVRGYVVIEVSGFSAERFINTAAHRGILLWDISRDGAKAYMKVSVKAFRRLKPCAKKSGCKIRITEKHGIPFIAHRYRKRKFLVLGILFFIASLYLLSSFIWLVEVDGNDRISSAEIISFLYDNGLKPGKMKHFISDKYYESLLLGEYKDISWTNIEIKGTRVTVKLTETIPRAGLIDRTTPCDIISDKEALIVSIATSAGTPKVKPGDVVSAGDILVSSEVLVGTPETGYTSEYVHAIADIRAKMYYEMKVEAPLEYYEKKYTGNVITNYSIILFGSEISVLPKDISYKNFMIEKSENRFHFGKDYPLPFVTVKREYAEFTETKHTRTAEDAKELCMRMINRRIISELDVEAEIADIQLYPMEHEDRVELIAVITTIESIGEMRPPDIDNIQ